MTRQEYLESKLEDLQVEVARYARTLQQLTRNVDKRYTSGTRDSIVSSAIKLHDLRVQLQNCKDDLRQRAKVEEQRLELLGCE
jgi:hypothetical protein